MPRDENIAKILEVALRFNVQRMSPHSNVCGVQEANGLYFDVWRSKVPHWDAQMLSHDAAEFDAGMKLSSSISKITDSHFQARSIQEPYYPEFFACLDRDITAQLKLARKGQAVAGHSSNKAIINYWVNSQRKPKYDGPYQCDPLVQFLRHEWKKSRVTEIPPILNPNSAYTILGFAVSTDLDKDA